MILYDQKFKFEEIDLKAPQHKEALKCFLMKFNLKLEEDLDYTVVIKEKNEIKGTGSKSKDIFKCIAVDEDIRNKGISSFIINKLIDKCFEEGIYHYTLFTKNENVQSFKNLGFNFVCGNEEISFLEGGIYDVNSYFSDLIKKYKIGNYKEKICGVIYSTKEEKEKLDLSNLNNVYVVNNIKYILDISRFPKYFLKESEVLRNWAEITSILLYEFLTKELNIKEVMINRDFFNSEEDFKRLSLEFIKKGVILRTIHY